MLKNKLLKYLENQTSFFDPKNVNAVFSASDISEKFSIKRNTASHYLNQLVEEELLVKVNTRPVYFFHKIMFEQQNYPLSQKIYQTLQEIEDEKPLFDKKLDFFQQVIGYHGSLAQTIEQLKMAALYPNGGLPILLTGESGTGKSYLVKLLYQYCLTEDLLQTDASFITVNCAQYADNKELLTSHLFGHVKGAFTGAEQDKKGVFELAANGFIFLDEVHRLSGEGQEKLFTFLDQGIIYPMGSGQAVSVSCRLAFATTQELSSTFLTTFLRRIPIKVHVPSLNERTRSEKKQLMIRSFYEEQQVLQKPLLISPQVLTILENHTYQGNVGELKNMVKIITAKSFTKNQQLPSIPVTLHALPDVLLKENIKMDSSIIRKELVIDGHNSLDCLLEESEPNQQLIIHSYEKIVLAYVNNQQQLEPSAKLISSEIDYLFDYLLFETKKTTHHKLFLFMTKHIRQTLEQLETSYQISFNGSLVYAISHYLYQRRHLDWFPEKAMFEVIEKLLTDIKNKWPTSYRYAHQILALIKQTLDIEVSNMDCIILAAYIHHLGYTKETSYPKAIIVAHGYATASSIANVVNRLLNAFIFQAFDMSLDSTSKTIADKINAYIEGNDVSNGMLILFDMGSLKEIHHYFSKEIAVPIVMMNNVTTSLALSIGEQIQKTVALTEIPPHVLKHMNNEWEILLPKTKKEQVIITTCATGIGTAVQISNLLESSLPDDLRINLIPTDFMQLKHADKWFNNYALYDVIGIIGTTNPEVKDIPFISLEELISGSGIDNLLDWFDGVTPNHLEELNNQLVRNFSLDRVIQTVTILDTDKVLTQIEEFLKQLEKKWEQRITNERKLSLYVHVSCLVERLIRNEPIEASGRDTLSKCHENALATIKEAFSVIEKVYSVKIPRSELFYIHDILFANLDKKPIDSDF